MAQDITYSCKIRYTDGLKGVVYIALAGRYIRAGIFSWRYLYPTGSADRLVGHLPP